MFERQLLPAHGAFRPYFAGIAVQVGGRGHVAVKVADEATAEVCLLLDLPAGRDVLNRHYLSECSHQVTC